jgi:exopolysaccharide biosynthesis WecB/TagA/CpsF family protein
MSKNPPQLFGVNLPQTNRIKLKNSIKSMKSAEKNVLYFHYSEFLLRANRNPWYKDTLNRANLSAIDGKGLHWAMWSTMNAGFLPQLYKLFFIYFPWLLRIPIFIMIFTIQLGVNLIVGFSTLLFRWNFSRRTKNEVILGRDFVYDLLQIAEQKSWKTVIIGGSSESDDVSNTLIRKIFPRLRLISWSRSYTSLLMQDQVLPEFVGQTLSNENVCQLFPDLHEAKQYIQKEKPDLVLVCLGGASGRQEFFIDHLAQDKSVSFALATGLGAAIDHLGGGAKQTQAPKWMISIGLEWLHRFISQPYRRKRIWDSIFTLWWWTTVQQFMQGTQSRPTVVNILSSAKKEILLVKRRNVLPGDIGWSFVQGGIEKNELPEVSGIREIHEEVGLEKHHLKAYLPSKYSNIEMYSISFLRFVLLEARFDSSKNYVNFVEYYGTKNPAVNWENQEAKWVDPNLVSTLLSVEKRFDWEYATEIIKATSP